MYKEHPTNTRKLNDWETRYMNRLSHFVLRLIQEERAQDMVEYALLAGFIAVAAGAVLPPVSESLSTIFSRMGSVVALAAN